MKGVFVPLKSLRIILEKKRIICNVVALCCKVGSLCFFRKIISFTVLIHQSWSIPSVWLEKHKVRNITQWIYPYEDENIQWNKEKNENLKATDNWPYLSQNSWREGKNAREAHSLFLFFFTLFFLSLLS